MLFATSPRRFADFFAGVEGDSRVSQEVLNVHCERVRATEHAPRGPFDLRERHYGLAEITERRAVV